MKNPFVLLAAALICIIATASITHYCDKFQDQGQEWRQVQNQITSMKPGDTLIIDERYTGEGITNKQYVPTTVANDKEDFSRIASFFGIGGPEAAAKSQGLKFDPKTGNLVSEGTHYGYGILEQLWSWIKSAFWFILIGFVILLVLCVIPQTSSFALGILRGIASIFPFVGSIVENIITKFTTGKAITQIVDGGEEFKTAINSTDFTKYLTGKDFTADVTAVITTANQIKTDVLAEFSASHNKAQDTSTQDIVAKTK